MSYYAGIVVDLLTRTRTVASLAIIYQRCIQWDQLIVISMSIEKKKIFSGLFESLVLKVLPNAVKQGDC